MTLAYLLFRLADTFEDAARWPVARRCAALESFSGLVRSPDPEAAAAATRAWLAQPPTDHAGYLELLAALPEVLAASHALPPAARDVVARHTERTCRGMADFLATAEGDGSFELPDLAALRRYCYAVAGIVGELLTQLFLLHDRALRAIADYLAERAASFGEALQLVNILKDSALDRTEGRTFLPPQLDRGSVLALARANLRRAEEYVRAVQRHASTRGAAAFTALPVILAWATLDEVERGGPGIKLRRERVLELAAALEMRLAAGEPAV